MRLFYATCPPGLEALAARIAASSLRGYAQKQVLSGALIFDARGERPTLPCFHNVYLLLGRADRCPDAAQAARQFTVDKQAVRHANQAIAQYGFGTLRVMFSNNNVLAPVEGKLRVGVEKLLTAAEINRERPDTELLFLARSEGFALTLLRLSMRMGQQPARGELSPAIAHAMVTLARPRADGVFVDPFAGHGALAKARMAACPARRMLLVDTDASLARALAKSLPAAQVCQGDALRLHAFIAPGEATEIVTDPPWGCYAPLPLPKEAFYEAFIAQCGAALCAGGMLVVLTADKEAFADALRRSAFTLTERFDLLVSGKKAALFAAMRGEDEQSPST